MKIPGNLAPKFMSPLILLLVAGCAAEPPQSGSFTLSVVGTNDVHGVFVPEPGRGGIATISGYVDAVRAARSEDGGSVLLIDAGDMWQGMLESNLNEGALMVAAYNEMGFAAAAIGNHEFDFGPEGDAQIPQSDADDPRGALKRRATEMNFPLLAANLIEESTGKIVQWDNVAGSMMVDVRGHSIGIVGVITESTLYTTIAPNIVGLDVTSLVDSILREATMLRANGATLVIVTAHSGSTCTEFDDPHDLSSCFMDGEIMRVANALPPGLVDHIIGGHTAGPIAHIVNGIVITSGVKQTQVFSRADFVLDRNSGQILDRIVFPPQVPCPWVDNGSGNCSWSAAGNVSRATYEGRDVIPDPAVQTIADRALAEADQLRNEALGPTLATPFTLDGNPESALGNLLVEALLDGVDGDIAIHNVDGGIRAAMPAGPVTFGDVYEIFPFDNRVVVLNLSGQQLRKLIAVQAHRWGKRAGIAGMTIDVNCESDEMLVTMKLDDGRLVHDDDIVAVITNDFLALGGDNIFSPVMPEGGFQIDDRHPLTRDVLVEWFRAAPDTLHASDFFGSDEPRWNLPEALPESCTLK